jgi:hypothetical protein
MNKLHPLADFTLRCRQGEILARIPGDFVDQAEGTLVIEVDAGMAETFLDGVLFSEVEEIKCKNKLKREGAYAMPIADISEAEPFRVKWSGNPHFLRQLRKPDFGANTVAFIVTQGGLTMLEGMWPFDEIPFYR